MCWDVLYVELYVSAGCVMCCCTVGASHKNICTKMERVRQNADNTGQVLSRRTVIHLMPATLTSAHHQFHSTETAVTKVYNDTLFAADRGQLTALCLLDLTAAFDTVDHDLLMLRLERQFGIHLLHLSGFAHTCKADRFLVIYGAFTSAGSQCPFCATSIGSWSPFIHSV